MHEAVSEDDHDASRQSPTHLTRQIRAVEEQIADLQQQLAVLRARHKRMQPSTRLSESSGSRRSRRSTTLLAARHVRVGRKLGAGFFGAVYEGAWRGVPCAVKFCSLDLAEDLLKEADVLEGLEHQNVMRFYGVSTGAAPPEWPQGLSPPCMCCELLNHTVLDFLKATPHSCLLDAAWWCTASAMLVGTARGLAYLHSLGIMHRDLKADNLLLDGNNTVKIADFGLAKVRDQRLRQTTSVGTFSHMAPEVMRGRYDMSADIFSFGIVVTEVMMAEEGQDLIDLTRTKEFGLNEAGLKSFIDVALQPAACVDLAGVAVACCALDPPARPTADALLETLMRLDEAFAHDATMVSPLLPESGASTPLELSRPSSPVAQEQVLTMEVAQEQVLTMAVAYVHVDEESERDQCSPDAASAGLPSEEVIGDAPAKPGSLSNREHIQAWKEQKLLKLKADLEANRRKSQQEERAGLRRPSAQDALSGVLHAWHQELSHLRWTLQQSFRARQGSE